MGFNFFCENSQIASPPGPLSISEWRGGMSEKNATAPFLHEWREGWVVTERGQSGDRQCVFCGF